MKRIITMLFLLTLLLGFVTPAFGTKESKPPKATLLRSPTRAKISVVKGEEQLFSEDFEGGIGAWTVTNGLWEVGSPTSGPYDAHSGSNCAATRLAGDYFDDESTRLVSPAVTLPSLASPRDEIKLYFWHWYEMESGYDYGYVQISTDGGGQWTTLGTSYNGSSNGWILESLSLSYYAGNDVRIAFYFSSDYSVNYPGWYVDDILIQLEITKNVNVRITQLDPSNFPTIACYTHVTNATGQAIEGLATDDFELTEQSEQESQPIVEKISVSPIQGGGGAGGIAVALVMDISGSMEGTPLSDAKVAANSLVDLMQPLDRMAVIAFRSWAWVEQSFTSDQGSLHSAINALYADGSTALFDAVYLAVDECVKEPGVKAIIALTDGEDNDSDYTLQEAINYANASNVPVYVVGLGSVEESVLEELAEDTNGSYYYAPTSSDLRQIYSDITTVIQTQYLITYNSHNPNYDGTTRTVTITVTVGGESDSDSDTYFLTQPPQIVRTQATIDLASQSQYAFQPLTIAAYVTDDVQVTEARLFYRTSGSGTSYTQVTMTNTSDDLYEATIPSSDVITPGVDYYLTASDGSLVVSDPPNNPQTYPYQIAILPNERPVITHTPVTAARLGDIRISANVTDATDYVDQVLLFYRTTGYVLYNSVEMATVGGDTYAGTIPGSQVTEEGIDYYIAAFDNHGVGTYSGSSASPYQITIGLDLLDIISAKRQLVPSLEEIYTVEPILGILDLGWKTGYEEQDVKNLLNNWESDYPSADDLGRTEALRRLLLFENTLKDLFYRDPDIPGAKMMAEDTMTPVVDVVLIWLKGVKIIKSTNQHLRGIPFLRGWADKITYRIGNLLLSLVLDTGKAIVSVATPDPQTARLINKAIDDMKEVMIEGRSEVIGIISGEAIVPIAAFGLLDEFYIKRNTQPALDAAFDNTSNLDYRGTFNEAQIDVLKTVNDVAYQTTLLHNQLIGVRQGLNIVNVIADLSAIAGAVTPGLQPLLGLAGAVKVVSTGAYAAKAGQNCYYLLATLPDKVDDMLASSFQTSLPKVIAAEIKLSNFNNPGPRKKLLTSLSQSEQTYNDILERTITAIEQDNISALKSLIPQLMAADEALQVQMANAWSPVMGVANQALRDVSGFEQSLVNSIDKPLSSNLERIVLYAKILEFLVDMGNIDLKEEIVSQANIVKEAHNSAEQSITEVLGLTSGLGDVPTIIIPDWSLPDELNSNQHYFIKATVENVGARVATGVKVSLSCTPDTLITVISLPVVNIGVLSSGGKSTIEWEIKAGQLADGITGALNLQIETYTGFATPFSKTVFVRNSLGPDTGGRISPENIYAYPNPFNPDREMATIRYSLAKDAKVTIKIYDVSGNLVTTLFEQKLQHKDVEYSESWDGKNDQGHIVANGVYFYRITTSAGEEAIGKVAVLR